MPRNLRSFASGAFFGTALFLLALAFLGCSASPDLYDEPSASTSQASAASTGTIEGFVFDRDTNPVTPVIGAKIYTLPTPDPGAITDAAGFYRIRGVRPGPYFLVSVDAKGKSLFGQTTVRAGQVSTLDLVYGIGPDGNRLEVGMLGRNFTPGVNSFATVGPGGAFFQLRPIPGLGGNLRSVRYSRADTDEVVLVSDFESPAGEIYVSNLRDSVTRRVTTNGFPEDSADLSPDGDRVVYAVDTDANGRFEIVTSRLDGTRLVTLVPDIDPGSGRLLDSRDPVWAPDGASIVFAVRRRDAAANPLEASFNIASLPVSAIVDPSDARFDFVIATGNFRLLTLDLFDDRNPSVEEGQANIYFDKLEAGHRQLYYISVTPGGTQQRLTNDLFENFHPTISFDGRLIAWVSTSTVAGRNPDRGPEVFLGEFLQRNGLVAGITNIRQLTETGPASAIDYAQFRPLFPGTRREVDAVLR